MSDLTCAECGRPMESKRHSRPQGQALCHPCRRRQRGAALTCATCGCEMSRRSSSAPQGEAVCGSCRSKARTYHSCNMRVRHLDMVTAI